MSSGFYHPTSQAGKSKAAVFDPTLRIGLEATIDNAQAGPESFFLGSVEGAVPVPEPATMLLLGTAW